MGCLENVFAASTGTTETSTYGWVLLARKSNCPRQPLPIGLVNTTSFLNSARSCVHRRFGLAHHLFFLACPSRVPAMASLSAAAALSTCSAVLLSSAVSSCWNCST